MPLAIFCMMALGCSSKPKVEPPPPIVKTFQITHHLGGTHYRSEAHNNLWYQTFDRSLLVIQPTEVRALTTVDLGKVGETGPAIDMLILGDRMFVVIEDDEVIELSLEVPQMPTVDNRISAATLGIRPRRLSEADGAVYVSGLGGVVRLHDRRRVFQTEEDASRVTSIDGALIACAGRRAYRLADERYLGSATELQKLPAHLVETAGGPLVFARQGEQGVLVGLMTADVREVDAQRATVAVPGTWRQTRIIGDRVWIITDGLVVSYKISERALTDPSTLNIIGARDLVQVSENYLGVSGNFGRTLYRMKSDTRGPGEQFTVAHREPSRLSGAITDGRYVLAGSSEGMWMYLVNARVEMTNRQFDTPPVAPQQSAVVASAQAKISDDRRSITITPSSSAAVDPVTGIAPPPFTHTEGSECMLRCVVAIDGDFWIGHDRGITVIKAGERRTAGRVRIAGPVLYIFPLLVGGGANFISEYGGFGVAKFVEEAVSSRE